MCAPDSTLAATAAAVPHSRPDGSRSPSAAFRKDFREGPERQAYEHRLIPRGLSF